ncbi:MAG TPA: hypothetical protein PKI62_03735 [bacterium]|nr:hypothetical protein [bacterium]HPR88603.1 hypothetical protein [bacterium]
MLRSAVRLFSGKSRRALLLSVLGAGSLFAQPVLHHVPPAAAAAGQDVPLQFSLTGYIGRVIMARVYYRSESETTYRSIDLASQPPGWQGAIPGRLLRGSTLYYFISVLLDNQSILTWPGVNPYNSPHAIALSQPAGGPVPLSLPAGEIKSQLPVPVPAGPNKSQLPVPAPAGPNKPQLPVPPPAREASAAAAAGDTLTLLSPEQEGLYASGEVMIAVSFYSESSRLNPKSVRIELDGRDVTAAAEISDRLISCSPPALAPGPHQVIIRAREAGGRTLRPQLIRFSIASAGAQDAPRPRPSFQGHGWAELSQEQFGGHSDGIAIAGADFSGKTGPFSYRGTLFLTSLESRHYQPRDRFGFSLGSRMLGISLGDSYPRLHELILAGRRVRGATGYVHLGLINVDLVYGQIQRAVQTRFRENGSRQLIPSAYGTFSQSIIGVRPSLGDGRVFQLGMTLARIRDDSTSIKMGLHPKDNLVIGPDVKLALFGSRVLLTGAAAISFLTQDISYGPATADDLKRALHQESDLPLDPADLADLLIINDSTVPLDPTSGSSLAWFLNLQLLHWGHAVNLGYRSIGGQYSSLANPWLRKDLRGFYLQDRFRLYQNKLYLDLGFEEYADNFSELNGNPRTDLRTLQGGLALFPGGSLPQINFNLRDQLRDNHLHEILQDSLAISSVTDTLITRDDREKIWFRDLTVQVSQSFALFNAAHQLSGSLISSRNIDSWQKERAPLLASADLTSRVTLVSLASRFALPFSSVVSYSSNHSEGASFHAIDYSTVAVSGEYRWLQDRLNGFAEWRRTGIRQSFAAAADATSDRQQFRVGLRWNLAAGQTLQGETQFWTYSAPAGADHAKTDRYFRVRYDRYF